MEKSRIIEQWTQAKDNVIHFNNGSYNLLAVRASIEDAITAINRSKKIYLITWEGLHEVKTIDQSIGWIQLYDDHGYILDTNSRLYFSGEER